MLDFSFPLRYALLVFSIVSGYFQEAFCPLPQPTKSLLRHTLPPPSLLFYMFVFLLPFSGPSKLSDCFFFFRMILRFFSSSRQRDCQYTSFFSVSGKPQDLFFCYFLSPKLFPFSDFFQTTAHRSPKPSSVVWSSRSTEGFAFRVRESRFSLGLVSTASSVIYFATFYYPEVLVPCATGIFGARSFFCGIPFPRDSSSFRGVSYFLFCHLFLPSVFSLLRFFFFACLDSDFLFSSPIPFLFLALLLSASPPPVCKR